MTDTQTVDRPKFTRGNGHPGNTQAPSPRNRSAKASVTGPYSRLIDRGALGAIDGSSREGRFLKAYEKMLIDHCGGNPSITQRALISRTARLALHLELMDERSLMNGREFGPTDHHFYVSWANALARHLDKLGLKRPAGYGRNPDVDAILAEMDRR